MLLPKKNNGKKVLRCRICNSLQILDNRTKESYLISKIIEHPTIKETKRIGVLND